MNTTTTQAANLYPFLSKAVIKARIEADPTFMLQCLQIMYSLQTTYEQETKSTLNRNRMGFMSSHAVNGSILAVKARSGGLTEEEHSKAHAIVSRSSRQLAAFFRREAIQANPELAATAALFSAE